MRYWMMQMLLTRRDEGTLFDALDPRPARQPYLAEVFNRETQFEYWNQSYVYKPFVTLADPAVVAGVIGRLHSLHVAGPPEEAFAPKQVQDWDTANVLINIASTPDGQKAAMQIGSVGNPLHIFDALAEQINSANSSSPWLINVNAVTRQEQFWEVAQRYQGHIKELDLSFDVPNIWDGASETEKALKRLRDENNAQEVEIKIKNKSGALQPDSQQIRGSVDYIAKGGGEAQIKDDHDTVVYSSKQEESVVATPVDPDPPIQEADEGMVRSLIRQIFGK